MKSKTTAILLCFFLGTLGIHRFYLGHTLIGVIQLLTLGACGIWTLIDFFRLIFGSIQVNTGDTDRTIEAMNEKNSYEQKLNNIVGISGGTADLIMSKFPNEESLKNASIEEIESIHGIGKGMASMIKDQI